MGLGFIFMFLPTLPLFFIGLGKEPRLLACAALAAAIIIASLAGLASMLVFLVLLALPAWYMADRSLRWRMAADGSREWMPLGLILIRLTIFGCAGLALITLFYAGAARRPAAHAVAEYPRRFRRPA